VLLEVLSLSRGQPGAELGQFFAVVAVERVEDPLECPLLLQTLLKPDERTNANLNC
jgi:hypothetical protein